MKAELICIFYNHVRYIGTTEAPGWEISPISARTPCAAYKYADQNLHQRENTFPYSQFPL